MEITGFRFRELAGPVPVADPETFYRSRVARPLDVYESYRAETPNDLYSASEDARFAHLADGELRVRQTFLHVDTDAGVAGVFGPLTRPLSRLVADVAAPLVGEDPLARRRCWDLMYRGNQHARKGRLMHAVSAVDCALWDLAGRHLDEPAYRLLGGPTRESLPAYASMLAFPTDDADAVREHAARVADVGYAAQKWFFPAGPGEGADGVRRNVDLVAAVRDAVGPDHDVMFDAWMAWDRSFARRVIDRAAEYDPRWIEEPVHADSLDACADLAARSSVPVAGGEHEYTRWGFRDVLARGAHDVLQPDPVWAGGVSEVDRVCALGAAHDVPVVPHGLNVPANVHVSAAQSPTTTPLVEYLVKWNEFTQLFLADPVHPEGGEIPLPEGPGLGMALDESPAETARWYDPTA